MTQKRHLLGEIILMHIAAMENNRTGPCEWYRLAHQLNQPGTGCGFGIYFGSLKIARAKWGGVGINPYIN